MTVMNSFELARSHIGLGTLALARRVLPTGQARTRYRVSIVIFASDRKSLPLFLASYSSLSCFQMPVAGKLVEESAILVLGPLIVKSPS
jgi:hypothetical protein